MKVVKPVWVESTPGCCGGRPRIAGHRLTVSHLLGCLAGYWTVETYARDWKLSEEQVRGALEWAANRLDRRVSKAGK